MCSRLRGSRPRKSPPAVKWRAALFLYCAGIEDTSNVSVQLIEPVSSKVVWAYAINKQRSGKNQQSMAEAVAKHLKEFPRNPARGEKAFVASLARLLLLLRFPRSDRYIYRP